MYGDDDLDLAGFALGIVERDEIVDTARVAAGDAVIGLASSGVHSNGFTLVRRLLERAGAAPGDAPGDLLAPTRIYAAAAAALRAACDVHAMAHITGGGLPGNLPRALPERPRRARRRGPLAGRLRCCRGSPASASSATRCVASSTAASATSRSCRRPGRTRRSRPAPGPDARPGTWARSSRAPASSTADGERRAGPGAG